MLLVVWVMVGLGVVGEYFFSYLSWLHINPTIILKILGNSRKNWEEIKALGCWFDKLSKTPGRVSFWVLCLQGAPSPVLKLFVSLPWQLAWRHWWPLAIISSLIIILLPSDPGPLHFSVVKPFRYFLSSKGFLENAFFYYKSHPYLLEKKIRELRTAQSSKYQLPSPFYQEPLPSPHHWQQQIRSTSRHLLFLREDCVVHLHTAHKDALLCNLLFCWTKWRSIFHISI